MAAKGLSVFTHEGEDYTINDPNIADEFSAGEAYSEDDFRFYQGNLQRFTADHAAGSWSGSDASVARVGDFVGSLKKSTNRIDNYIRDISENIVIDFSRFELGTITDSGGSMSYPASTTRVRTEKGFLYNLKKNAIIQLSDYSAAQFIVIYYDKNGTIHTMGTWISSGNYICTEDGRYGIIIEYKNERTVTSKNALVSLLQIRDFYVFENPDINQTSFWEIGSISGAGLYTNNSTRCRTRPFKVKAGDIVTCKRGSQWDCSYAILDDDGAVIEASSWLTEQKMNYDGNVVIVCRKGGNDSVTITDALIAELVPTIRFVRKPYNYYPVYMPKYHGTAHSGGHFGPRNNAITYVNAYKQGFRYAETDVAVTSDGYFVCVHDATINSVARNPDGSEIVGDVHVNDSTYEELLEYDFGIAYGQEYVGTKVSLFSEVLNVCQKLGMFLFVDFSAEDGYTKAQMGQIMKTVNDAGMNRRVAYVPADMDYVDFITEIDETATIGLVRSASQPTYVYRCFTGKNAVFMSCQYGTITPERVEVFREMGVPLEAYTVDDVDVLEGLSDYITGVTSDDICADKYWREKLTE